MEAGDIRKYKPRMKYYIRHKDKTIEVYCDKDGDALITNIENEKHRITLDKRNGQIRSALIEELKSSHNRSHTTRSIQFGYQKRDNIYEILIDGINYKLAVSRMPFDEGTVGATIRPGSVRATVEIKAPIPGLISSVNVKVGDKVREGQHLITLNAMKLENEITASRNGVVKTIYAKSGKPVEKGEVLIVISGG
ncbi:MAG: hypothetical protein A2W23_07300 [Planctomycetes bacterium RBG_16_43_13]|nr:MAG: hypothetical protein A2W23_07300 [Planctomycetes bacterium RBG_16_43_13]